MTMITGPGNRNNFFLGPVIDDKKISITHNEINLNTDVLNFFNETNQNQKNAEDLSLKLAMGESKNVHEAMLGLEKANLSMQFTVQVRNKVIEAYQEIMRMQV